MLKKCEELIERNHVTTLLTSSDAFNVAMSSLKPFDVMKTSLTRKWIFAMKIVT